METFKIPAIYSNWLKYDGFLKKHDAFLHEVFNHFRLKQSRLQYEQILESLLHRYAMNFKGIQYYWRDFFDHSKYKFSIYTLLRPLLADYLTMLFLLEELNFDPQNSDNPSDWKVLEEGFVKQFELVSNSFFTRIEKHLRKKVDKNEISDQEMRDIMLAYKEAHPRQFESGKKVKVLKKGDFPPGVIAGKLVKGKRFATDVYDHYLHLSQYEHFTVKTEELMYETPKNIDMLTIVSITDSLLESLGINLSSLLVPVTFKEKLIALMNDFRSTEWLEVDQQLNVDVDTIKH